MIRKKFLLWMKKEPKNSQESRAGLVSTAPDDIPVQNSFKHGNGIHGRIKAASQSMVNMPNKTRDYR
ncbi:MAG: hypothetical protein CVV21_04870 [Candidatus Goldiibacteriota bacterium HGW-Goldbacteria-1]|jgi:hypothetical protein|nr:MAG: hypothetical protein CVV21_04870 [Candidatus Goldiibacteriota bacterium HGW-Goldbacteria-1]